jgi:class 3 adenylate cyclase
VYEARPPDSSGPAPLVDSERFLATLLFTDIVRSTAAAAEAGDRNWRRVVEQHHAIVRDELQRHGGLEADTAGDGFYATFDAPSHAIDCARALRDRLRTIGVEIRAGVHVGECQVVAGKIGGIAVALGSRVMSQGGAGDLLVSQTVKDLLLGTKFVFAERGRVSLKGVPGEWTLYTVED